MYNKHQFFEVTTSVLKLPYFLLVLHRENNEKIKHFIYTFLITRVFLHIAHFKKLTNGLLKKNPKKSKKSFKSQ